MMNESTTDILHDGLVQLGLESEVGKLLYFVKDKTLYAADAAIWFQLEKAESYKAHAVFLKKSVRKDEYIPHIYIYDQTNQPIAEERAITEIHKNVWTGGEVPLVCIFTKTEIKILDTTCPIKETQKGQFSPTYLVENLKTVANVHEIFNQDFARKLKAGTYWDSSNIDFYKNSSYSKLTALLRNVINRFTDKSGLEGNREVVQKLIIQCILIKYLEERRDENNGTVFPSSFFQKYQGAEQFSDVLKNGSTFTFFDDLNRGHFNGGIFDWDSQRQLFDGKQQAFDYLAEVLRGYLDNDQLIIDFEDNFSRLYSFNYIPVELISRLYEEFIIKETEQEEQNSSDQDKPQNKNEGIAYTPSHLVKLLVDEAMPLREVPDNIDDFRVLDPACGSAIFLVVAFKRLVQWWRQKNGYKKPDINVLLRLLDGIYGVDKDPRAVQISVFSLCIALCDELSPKEIWDNLKFENLEGKTIFHKDFFLWQKERQGAKFDLVIGNPPFIRGGLENDLRKWKVNNSQEIKIPHKQIALKFLAESLSLLKENGLSCLIVKALPLLYSNTETSKKYIKALVQNFHVEQIFDFTPLARNGALWDGVDVDTAAVFVTNAKPNHNKNVLHAIFRRTKANQERIYFEIDKYDLHFILRDEICAEPYLFKINLLGGGRIKNLVHRLNDLTTLFDSKDQYNIEIGEGFEISSKGTDNSDFLYELPYLPSKFLTAGQIGINYADFPKFDKTTKFKKASKELLFRHPNILIKENISLSIVYNNHYDFSYPRKIIGIASKSQDVQILSAIYDSFVKYRDVYQFFIAATSAQVLVLKNSALYFEDIKRLPILTESFALSPKEQNVITDVLDYTQYFIRQPESAKALRPLDNIQEDISFYGKEFSDALNDLYTDKVNNFKLTHIIHFEKDGLIGALFAYNDGVPKTPETVSDSNASRVNALIHFDINESLTATRIIQYYAPNQVLFVKPNQKRFWLASIAYRDADSVFADILNTR